MLYAGAGLGAQAGYPTWPMVLAKLLERVVGPAIPPELEVRVEQDKIAKRPSVTSYARGDQEQSTARPATTGPAT